MSKILPAIFLILIFQICGQAWGCEGRKLSEKTVSEIVDISKEWPQNIAENTPILIEFYDYLCGYCKTSYRAIQSVKKKGNPLTIIYRPIGKLGPLSMNVATAALAAHEQDKFFEFNDRVMRSNHFPSESFIQKIADELSLDLVRFEKDRQSDKIYRLLDENAQLFERLSIKTVPSYILGNCHIMNSMTEAEFKKALQ